MKELERLRALVQYKIMDTIPEEELDEIAEIALAICDTPVSLITLLDDKRQWFKAKKGLDIDETPRDLAFCQHALHNPKSVLVVDDPLNDERFKNNPLVTGNPNIRFYAGAPLETPDGNVLGTLCIIDDKPHKISERQEKALMLLAKRVMNYFETRKILIEQSNKIEFDASRLKKLTDQTPGVIYQLEMNIDGKISLPFISKGISIMYPHLNIEELKENPEMGFKNIHPEDLPLVQKSIKDSFGYLVNWNIEFRVISNEGKMSWYWANAKPERKEDGTVIWYGNFQDITGKKEYIRALEEILADISHVMRKPISSMLGLTALFTSEDYDKKNLPNHVNYLNTVSKELDEYTVKLNRKYSEIKLRFTEQPD